MLVLRGYGLAGLGLGDTPPAPAPLTEGYCLKPNGWLWVPADQCSVPVKPGGPPMVKPGFCWIRLNPPNAIPGYWTRATTGQACEFEGPPTEPQDPNDAPGFCKDADGVWHWVLQSQCAVPVVAGTDPRTTPGGGGGVTVTNVSDVLDINIGNQMTISEVNRLFQNKWKAYWERESAAVKAWAASGVLAPCPPETVNKPTCIGCKPTCYNYSPITMAETIPGTFEVLGVPFNIVEPGVVKSPNFERVYTPNNEQRIFVERQIIHRSMAILNAAITDVITVSRTNPADAIIAKLSVQQVLDLLPRWKLAVPGMAMRSVLPRGDELTGEGGLLKWLKRGFLISLDVAEGKEKLYDETSCPQACIGNKCSCPGSDLPACIATGVPTTESGKDLSTGCFWWYAQVDPSGQVKLIGKHDDPNWLQRVGAKLGGFMESFGNAICGALPAVQAQTQATVAEKCADKAGKPCTKGAAGCICTTASAAAVGGVGIFNFVAGKFCSAWTAEYAQDPIKAMPPVPDPIPLPTPTPTWLKFLPWVLGGLAVGAGTYAFSRR